MADLSLGAKIGRRLTDARERLGLTQVQVGALAHLNPLTVSHYECGRRLPSLPNLVALALALRVSVDWLLHLENVAKVTQWPRSQKKPWGRVDV